MANWNSALATLELAGRSQIPSHGLGFNMKAMIGVVTFGSGLALNDTINFGKLPAGARIVEATLYSTALDSNGSPTIKFDVGDATNGAAAIFTQSVVGQLGGVDAKQVTASVGLQYLVDTMITGLIHTGPATGAAGTLALVIQYVVDSLPS